MGKRLDGSSIFTGVNAGLANAYSMLANQYKDDITLENINKALTNTNNTNNSISTTFAGIVTFVRL